MPPDTARPTDPPDASAVAATLWSSPTIALLVVDSALRIRHINPYAAALLGWSGPPSSSSLADLLIEEDYGRLGQATPPDGNGASGPHLLRARSEGGAADAEEVPALLVSAVRIDASDPAEDKWLLVGRDGSAEARREARVRRAARYEIVARVAKAIGHDLNNALATVTSLSELLVATAEPGSETVEDLTAIKDAAWRAASISRKLQLFANGRGGTPPSAEGTDVSAAVKSLEPLLRRFLPGSITLEIETDPACPPARISGATVDEMVMVLASQAGDAMPRGGRLRITVRPGYMNESAPTESAVIIEVADDGVRTPPAPSEEALEPLVSNEALGAGTGLGLDAVASLVAEAGGRMDLHRDRRNGTTVQLTLAVAKPEVRDPTGVA